MGAAITGRLTGPLRTELWHGPSGTSIETAGPVDIGGDAARFSPIELCAAALASCAATAMSLHAKRNGIPLDSIEFWVEPETSTDLPRRISKLSLHFRISSRCSASEYAALVEVGKACPVRQSLHPNLEVCEEFTRAG